MSRLDAAGVRQPLTEPVVAALETLEVFERIASTNTYLMSQPPPPPGRFRVALADHQTSGRGRHFRRWLSAPGASLCLSFGYSFAAPGARLDGLTLAIGVAAAAALQRLGVDGVRLKWPNDIVAQDGKLGGILTEVQSGRATTSTVVTGIGLNVDIGKRLDVGTEPEWAQRAVDIRATTEAPPSRELLAATLIDELFHAFRRFENAGLAAFMDDWRTHDWLCDREITVDTGDRQIAGVARGVDDDGLLLVDTSDGRVAVISGSIIKVGPAGEAR